MDARGPRARNVRGAGALQRTAANRRRLMCQTGAPTRASRTRTDARRAIVWPVHVPRPPEVMLTPKVIPITIGTAHPSRKPRRAS
jgi:hypothetical protein